MLCNPIAFSWFQTQLDMKQMHPLRKLFSGAVCYSAKMPDLDRNYFGRGSAIQRDREGSPQQVHQHLLVVGATAAAAPG